MARRPAKPADEREAEEQALVAAINRGETQAWARLLSEYQDRLYGVCLRMVGDREMATDLTQDAMVRIIQGLASYDGRSRLSTWMIRVTMNVCLSRLRSEKHRRHASLDAVLSDDSRTEWSSAHAQTREPPASSGVERDESRLQIIAAMSRISPEHRAILVLRDVQGLDYEQIAQALEVAVGTVKSRLFRARLALRRALEGQDSSQG
jgi:RNA polymerase sigma-70 factor (ECF subfamily)